MTVPSETSRQTHAGNDVATSFEYGFPIFDEDHLRVTLVDAAGDETVLTKTTHYTVTGVDLLAGGTVEMVTPPATGESLYIDRVLPVTQLIDVRNTGEFLQETHERAWDLLCMMIQMHHRLLQGGDPDLSRCLMLGATDVSGSGSYRGQSNRIQDIDDPINAQDVATMAWVIAQIGFGTGAAPPLYTTATRPTPDASNYGTQIRVKDPGLPESTQACGLRADGITYEWYKLGEARSW
jgi:hypothetical protein